VTDARCGAPRPLASGTTLCLASPFSPLGYPRGPRRELLRHDAPGLYTNLAQASMSVYSYCSAAMGSTLVHRVHGSQCKGCFVAPGNARNTHGVARPNDGKRSAVMLTCFATATVAHGQRAAFVAFRVFFEERCLRHQELDGHVAPGFGCPCSPLFDVQPYRGHLEATQEFPGQTGKGNVGVQSGIQRRRQEAKKAVG
jgi:hypothetical protein